MPTAKLEAEVAPVPHFPAGSIKSPHTVAVVARFADRHRAKVEMVEEIAEIRIHVDWRQAELPDLAG